MKIIKIANTIHVVSAIKAETLKTLERVGQNVVELGNEGNAQKRFFAFQTSGVTNDKTAVFSEVTDDGYASVAFCWDGEKAPEDAIDNFVAEHLALLNNIKEAEPKLKAIALAREADIEAIKNSAETITLNGGEEE